MGLRPVQTLFIHFLEKGLLMPPKASISDNAASASQTKRLERHDYIDERGDVHVVTAMQHQQPRTLDLIAMQQQRHAGVARA